MTIRDLIRSDIEKSIEELGFVSDEPVVINYPSDPSFGDYATNWPLQASNDIKQSPTDIAKKIQSRLSKSDVYKTKIAGSGFLNFELEEEFLVKHLRLVVAESSNFGSSNKGKGRKVLVEYSSPNIAKPMHVGHLRNTNLGASLVKILSFNSYQTISDNHIGDWGTQFGALLWAYKNWGSGVQNPQISALLNLYIRFNTALLSNPDLEKSAREEFRKLEQGDPENRKLWETFKDVSLAEFNRLYQDLGVVFDLTQGESFYEKDLPKVVKEVLKKGVAKKDPDGSVVVTFEGEGMSPLLILKSDGATLYGTRDLATAKYRIEKIKPDKILYVIGSEQTLYLKQIFSTLHKLGWGQNIEWHHVSYGLTRLPQGKMSTRLGDLVTAADLIAEAKKKAQILVKEKDAGVDPDNETVNAVALGAIKWHDLKTSRESEVLFDWDQVFNIEGNTGPYLQYSFARTQSLLAKASFSEKLGRIDAKNLIDESERSILRQLVKFPEVIQDAGESFHPHLICNYLFQLAQSFSRFYEKNPVLIADVGIREARLGLVSAVGVVLRNGLTLLGIATPNRL